LEEDFIKTCLVGVDFGGFSVAPVAATLSVPEALHSAHHTLCAHKKSSHLHHLHHEVLLVSAILLGVHLMNADCSGG
jgi:hypothetical protein